MVKVFSSDDKSLKTLGELLGNKTSRRIIRALIEKEMYTNQLVKELDLPVPVVIHHLRKLEEVELITITWKKIVKKGKDHRFFRMTDALFILPNETKDQMVEKGTLKKFFKEGVTFACYSGGLIISFLSGKTVRLEQGNVYDESYHLTQDTTILILLLIGLGIFFVVKNVKRKKRLEV